MSLYVVPSGGATSGLCPQSAPCTLNYAIDEVNGDSGLANDAVTISLAAGTYTSSSTPTNYEVDDDHGFTLSSLEIVGPGTFTPTAILNGQGLARVLEVTNADYYTLIQGIAIENGYSTGYGANVLADTVHTGTVGLVSDVITGGNANGYGQADDIGAGFLDVANSTVENAASGTNGSEAAGANGGIYVSGSTYSNDDSALVQPSGSTSQLTVSNSTVANNHGFGIVDDTTEQTYVVLSTISGNEDAGLVTVGSTAVDVEFEGDILEGNDGTDCDYGDPGVYQVTDGGDNVLDDSTCDLGTSNGSKVVSASSIGLGALGNDGSSLSTERITTSSSAYDVVSGVGTGSACQTYSRDERGFAELQGSATKCDAGAYQVAPPSISPASPASGEPGTKVNLTGSNLVDVSSVTFGGADVAATITSQSNTQLTVVVPQLAHGSQPITVTSPDGTATVAYTVTGPSITTTVLPAAEVAHSYSTTLVESGGAGALTWRITSGALPSGIAMSSTGAISGTPTSATTASFTVTVTDGDGQSVSQALTLSVLAPQILIDSSSVKFKGKGAPVKLTCDTAACAGVIKLVKIIHVKVKHGHKTKTLIIATCSYSLAPATSDEFTISLQGIEKHLIAAASLHAIHLTLVVSDGGGDTEGRAVKVT